MGGVHLTLRGSAVPMLVLVGWITDGSPVRAPLWVTAGLVALAAHELAHARVARRGGATPLVELSWRGGLTRWFPPGQLSRSTEARALLAGPLAGLLVAFAADTAASAVTGTHWAADLSAQWLAILAGLSVVLAVLDLLPVFPRDGSRLVLLLLGGPTVANVVRAGAVGSVAASVATAVLLAVTPWPLLALVPGLFVLTNTWLAVHGDRAIGPPSPEAIARRDWRAVRRRVVAGCETPTGAAAAQQAALTAGDNAAAADIGDAALSHGWRSTSFATRTAVARLLLEEDDRAMALVHQAVALGADPDELAATTPLGQLRHRFDWPDAAARAAAPPPFVIDLRDRTARA